MWTLSGMTAGESPGFLMGLTMFAASAWALRRLWPGTFQRLRERTVSGLIEAATTDAQDTITSQDTAVPTVRYRTRQGLEVVTTIDPQAARGGRLRPGQRVTLIYDQERPHEVVINGHVRDRIALLLLFTPIVFFALIGAVMVVTTFVSWQPGPAHRDPGTA